MLGRHVRILDRQTLMFFTGFRPKHIRFDLLFWKLLLTYGRRPKVTMPFLGIQGSRRILSYALPHVQMGDRRDAKGFTWLSRGENY